MDPPATPNRDPLEALLAHAGWVRRIARDLCFDPSRAEDVAQQSLLDALVRPPRDPSRMGGWLKRVVENTAQRIGRAESRLRARESRSIVPEDPPDPESLVVATEVQRRVAAAVASLDPPYRSTILMRYFDGLSTDEIAMREHVSKATVRSRHARALERLREMLDAEFGGGSGSFRAALAPIAGAIPGSQTLVSSGGATFGAGWITMVSSTSSIGKWAVSLLVLGVGVTAAIGWVSRSSPPRTEMANVQGEGPDRENEEEARRDATVPVAAAPDDSIDANDSIRSTAESGERVLFAGIVVGPDDAPVAGARLQFFGDEPSLGDPRPLLAEVESSENGAFRAEIVRVDSTDVSFDSSVTARPRFRLEARASGLARTVNNGVSPSESLRVKLAKRAVLLFGRVLDAKTGEPIAGAEITGSFSPTRSTTDGFYRIDDAPFDDEFFLTAIHDAYAESTQSLVLRDAAGATRDIEMEPGHIVTGRIVDLETREVIPGASIEYGERSRRTTRADERGGFAIRLAAGARGSVWAFAPGSCRTAWGWDVGQDAVERCHEVPLAFPATFDLFVVDPDGNPCDEFTLEVSLPSAPFGASLDDETMASFGLPGSASLRVTRIGEFARSEGVPPVGSGHRKVSVVPAREAYEIVVKAKGYANGRRAGLLLNRSGNHETVTLTLEPDRSGTMSGNVSIDGLAYRGRVAWRNESGAYGVDDTDENGAYRLERVAPGPVRLSTYGDERAPSTIDESLVVEPGSSVRHDVERPERLATISGRVVFANGAAIGESMSGSIGETDEKPRITVATTVADGDSGQSIRIATRMESDGTFHLSVPRRDSYTLEATAQNVTGVLECVPPDAKDLKIVLPRTGRLRLELVDAATGRPPVLADSQASFAWRKSGATDRDFVSRARPLVDASGIIDLELEATTIDFVLRIADSGFVPTRVDTMTIPESPGIATRRLALVRGVDVVLRTTLANPEDRTILDGHNFFLLREDEREGVSGPFDAGDLRANARVNGAMLRLSDLGFLDRLVALSSRENERVRGLAPGRYLLLPFPNDLVIEPPSIEVGAVDPTEYDVLVARR